MLLAKISVKKAFSNKLCLSGGTVDLLIGPGFAGGIVDIHVIPGKAEEPMAKKNCFGWYVMGQLSERDDRSSAISSVDVETAEHWKT